MSRSKHSSRIRLAVACAVPVLAACAVLALPDVAVADPGGPTVLAAKSLPQVIAGLACTGAATSPPRPAAA